MTLNEIKELMQDFDKSGIHSLKIENKEIKLELNKADIATVSIPQYIPSPISVPMQTASVLTQSDTISALPTPKASGKTVRSPLVGVFYRSSSPDTKPYVEVGQKIKAGDILCLIEAMKIVNEIKSPVDGTISAIHTEDSTLVSFNEILIEIEE